MFSGEILDFHSLERVVDKNKWIATRYHEFGKKMYKDMWCELQDKQHSMIFQLVVAFVEYPPWGARLTLGVSIRLISFLIFLN